MAYTAVPNFTKKQLSILHALCHTNGSQRKALLRTADKPLVKCICESILNIISGTIEVNDTVKNRLKKHKKVLRKLASGKKTKKSNWQKKKKIILQHGGGAFLPLVLAPLVNVIASKIFSSIFKNKK